MVDGNQKPLNPASMLFALSIVSLEKVFFRRTISGSFAALLVWLTDKMYSKLKNSTVPISSPDSKMTDSQLNMLMQREQLMEDIDCIIESNFGEVEYKDDVIRMLCDAVCKNFPTK